MSKGSQAHSQHLRGPQHVLNLWSSGTVRACWVPILTRGKLHIEPLPAKFPSAAPGEAPPLPGAARRRHAVEGPEASPEHKRARDAA